MKLREMPFLDAWIICICRRAFPTRYVPEAQAVLEAHDPVYEDARRITATARGAGVLRTLRSAR